LEVGGSGISLFKVYLVCAAIYFLSAPLAGFNLTALIESDRSGTVGRLASARVADNDPGGCPPAGAVY